MARRRVAHAGVRDRHPDVCKRIFDEGHEFGRHVRDLDALTKTEHGTEGRLMRLARSTSDERLGARLWGYRPPYRDYNWA